MKQNQKFTRVGLRTGREYDRGYSDSSHPASEIVIYKYPEPFSIQDLWDKDMVSLFMQMHRALPFDEANGSGPGLDSLKVVRSENIESRIFPGNEAEVYLADCTTMGGTGSLKDPDAFVTLYRLKELGHNSFALASTGDCGASFCYSGSKLEMDIHLFVPEDCYPRWEKLQQEMEARKLFDNKLIHVYRKGKNMHEAFDHSVDFAHEREIPHDYFFNNQLRIEGSKTLHFQTFRELGCAPDFYIQSLGSGTGLFAMWKASHDLGLDCPQLVGVQPAGCSPMVRASVGQAEQEYADTTVMGIGLPKLGPAYPYLKDLNTMFIAVHEGGRDKEIPYIRQDIKMLKESGIVNPGLESSLTVSGLGSVADIIRGRYNQEMRRQRVVLGITGQMREEDKNIIY